MRKSTTSIACFFIVQKCIDTDFEYDEGRPDRHAIVKMHSSIPSNILQQQQINYGINLAVSSPCCSTGRSTPWRRIAGSNVK